MAPTAWQWFFNLIADVPPDEFRMPSSKPKQARTVLITGSARRIGRAIAINMARDDWSVGVHYHGSRDAADALVSELQLLGANVAAIGCDLTQTADVATLIPRCSEALGPISCLINNASEFRFDTIATLDATGWDRHQAVNVKAPILLSQHFAAQLPLDQHGHIINIIDQRAWAPTPDFFSYTVSKSALWTATRMLAQALSPRIRVNAIGPGPVLQGPHQSTADFEAEAAATPLQRSTSPAEIADAVRFIIDAPAMTGQMIALDGGQHLRWFPETIASSSR